METISLDLVIVIASALDPENRHSLFCTCRAFLKLSSSIEFPAYQHMNANAPRFFQRLEAIACEGTLSQRNQMHSEVIAPLDYHALVELTTRVCYYRMMAFMYWLHNATIPQIPNFQLGIELVSHLAASLGRLDILQEWRSRLNTMAICLTGIVHGHIDVFQLWMDKNTMHSANSSHCDSLAWTDDLSILALLYISGHSLPHEFSALIKKSRENLYLVGCEKVQFWNCPICPSHTPLLELCDDLCELNFLPSPRSPLGTPRSPLGTPQSPLGTPWGPLGSSKMLDCKVSLLNVYPLSCDGYCLFCVECLSHQVLCPHCEQSFGKFIGCEDADNEIESYMQCFSRALLYPTGIPHDCFELIGPDGGYQLRWRCKECDMEWDTCDK